MMVRIKDDALAIGNEGGKRNNVSMFSKFV